ISYPYASAEEASRFTPRGNFVGHTGVVWVVLHLLDGQRIVTCSGDGSLRVWDLESEKQIGDDLRDGEGAVWTMALSPDGTKMVSGSLDGVVRLWDIDTGKVIARWTGHTMEVTSVCWSGDGRRVASGSNDGTVKQWDVLSGATILKPIETEHTHVKAVVYSPDMAMFAIARRDKFSMIEIWDANTCELVATLKGQKNFVLCLAWTADGKSLISGSDDGSIWTWGTTSWKVIAVLGAHTTGVSAIAISPNCRILASASSDRTARLWNLKNGQPIGLPLEHANIVSCVSFSADGKLLATGSYDHNAYTWDVSAHIREAGLNDFLLDPNDGDNLLGNADVLAPLAQLQDDIQAPPEIIDDSPDRVDSSSTHQPSYATPVPILNHLPTSSTHEPTTLAPLRRFLSFFRPSQPDPNVAPHLSPRPWLGFLSRQAPSARTVGQRKSVCSLLLSFFLLYSLYSSILKRLYVARAPNTKPTSNRQLKQQPSQGGALSLPLLHPQAAVATATSPLAPRPAITTPVGVTDTLDASTEEAGCCTRFWSSFCCVSTTKSAVHKPTPL
ncbi:WD40 repeat-like protein, partial [Suillus brevipes Sb2]